MNQGEATPQHAPMLIFSAFFPWCEHGGNVITVSSIDKPIRLSISYRNVCAAFNLFQTKYKTQLIFYFYLQFYLKKTSNH